MGNDWPIVKLGDYCKKIGSGATPKGGSSVYLDLGDVCLIRSQNIYNEGFSESGLVYIDDIAATKLKNVEVEKNDVLLNITGDSVARVCLAPSDFLPARVNQHVAIIRPNAAEFDARFLRYLLASPKTQKLLLNLASAGATRNALTKGMIEDFEVSKPPVSVQTGIANLLESLDNKITLNRQINQTLEQMAQTLFKSWFVDFDPVIDNALDAGNPIPDELQHRAEARKAVRESEGFKPLPDDVRQLFPDAFEESELGWVPKGWEIKCLRDLSEKISKGTTPRRSDLESAIEDTKTALFVKVKDMTDDSRVNLDSLDSIPKSVSTGVLKRSVLCEGDILLSIAGTIGRVASVERELDGSNCNQAVAFLRPKDRLAHHLFIKQTLLGTRVRHYINSKVVQAVQANFSLTHFGEIQTVMPSEQVIKQFNLLANTYSSRSLSTFRQNDTLTKLRDTLLPKLISGELRLDEVELAVEQEAVSAEQQNER
ncbi:restriction endonuclease subunit S [Vibrio cholerae]|nr:restriction endonuclease subunit S [Vibrio cholerae]